MTEYVPASDLAEIVTTLREGDEEARLAAVRRLSKEPPGSGERQAALDVLIDIMGDESWQVRKEAVASVLCWTDLPLLSEKLVEAMGEPDNVGRRNAVIDGVMRLGAICIDPLLRHLKQKPEHRKVLVDVLGTFGDTRVIPALGESLLDEDPNVRAAAMEQLASFSHQEVIPALHAALRSPDLLVVLAALDGLNRQRVVLALAELQPMLEQAVLRPALMSALGHSQDVGAVPALIEGLMEKARGAREAALVGLFRLYHSLAAEGKQAIVDAIRRLDEMTVRSMLRALMEATPPVRQATAALLGWTGKTEMLRPLLLALGDADGSVQEAAAQALLDMDSGEATLTTLVDLTPTLDPRSRGNLCRFFAKHAAPVRARISPALQGKLVAILETARGDKNAQTAAAAAQALAAITDTQPLAPGGPDSAVKAS